VDLLTLLWETEPPDLVIVETLDSLPDPALLQVIGSVTATGLPVWVGFRRGGAGVYSADGDEMPDTDPGAFAEAIGALEEAGIRAAMVNCVPVGCVVAALETLSAATSLPIGCYPRLGRPRAGGWVFEDLDPPAYGELAVGWRSAGASIIGGCCGVTPDHVRSVRDRVARRPADALAG
jgi:S-methylmethionine-dependent homocysteine/selenocysteine methylase